jgi:hypothetical protein
MPSIKWWIRHVLLEPLDAAFTGMPEGVLEIAEKIEYFLNHKQLIIKNLRVI